MLKINHAESQSETAVCIYFDGVDGLVNMLAVEISFFAEYLRECLTGVVEIIPGSVSIFIEFHVLKTDLEQIVREVKSSLADFLGREKMDLQHEVLELPVYYHPEVAPDLVDFAKQKKLSIEEVIKLHSEASYTVASLGFAPGFAYLSGLNDRLATPRHASPRTVAKGSLGIAGQQTAVYPNQSPGGWVIIGNCPIDLFDMDADPITPFKVGSPVRFVPITRDEFLAKGGEL